MTDLDVLGDTLDEFADKVPGLSPEDALEVLWAVARLADAIESGKWSKYKFLISRGVLSSNWVAHIEGLDG